ncbi:hypothetical protein BRE01_66820 [Brevibacillus reuszeri]|uniref:Uncharacterized protein n=1 Tax=Brevibacillus reuszeri TaxID=54915 RepID=A0A0K9YP41_9BACL|nr:hypothetical protein ADS79_16330 [Brevibacillus reuszeri]GED72980.1 hypothetical protein BRE01_66820 [Brevibacillus reuszeri]
MYDSAYAKNETSLNEFKELSQELLELLDHDKNEEGLIHFVEGISISKEVIRGMFQQCTRSQVS